jgi:hypothetical protein
MNNLELIGAATTMAIALALTPTTSFARVGGGHFGGARVARGFGAGHWGGNFRAARASFAAAPAVAVGTRDQAAIASI